MFVEIKTCQVKVLKSVSTKTGWSKFNMWKSWSKLDQVRFVELLVQDLPEEKKKNSQSLEEKFFMTKR